MSNLDELDRFKAVLREHLSGLTTFHTGKSVSRPTIHFTDPELFVVKDQPINGFVNCKFAAIDTETSTPPPALDRFRGVFAIDWAKMKQKPSITGTSPADMMDAFIVGVWVGYVLGVVVS